MENMSLGKCCACEAENETVRNIIMLDKKSLDEKGGWGCFICGLDARGATSVLCHSCLDSKSEIKFACLGYPKENRRIKIDELTEVFEHDLSKHADEF